MLRALLVSVACMMSGVYLYMHYEDIQKFMDPAQCESSVYVATLGTIQVGSVIGKGAFSLVMNGRAVSSAQPVAIKIGLSPDSGLTQDEFILSRLGGSKFFPQYYGSGRTRCTSRGGRVIYYPFVVMEKLGKTTGEIAEGMSSREDRLEFALSVGIQTIRALQVFHANTGHIVHDLYPMNIALAAGENKQIKLFDFGEIVKMNQLAPEEYLGLNKMYSSVREDGGFPLSYRDDIERLVYTIFALTDLMLPWSQPSGKMVFPGISKVLTPLEEQCAGFPSQIHELLVYARTKLGYNEFPDYAYVENLLVAAAAGERKTVLQT